MKLFKIQAVLSNRDAALRELRHSGIVEVNLADVLPKVVEHRDDKPYDSIQGPTISPSPMWIVEVKSFRRNVGGSIQQGPKVAGGRILVSSSRRASKVAGTGAEKAKWRAVNLEGEVQSQYLYTVGTSTWLVPFAIGHRFVAVIPATEREDGRVEVHHELCHQSTQSLRGFSATPGGPTPEIRRWAREAQKLWTESKKDASSEVITKWLDFSGKLSRIDWSRPRVIHTRSRTFYAALMQPTHTTALGLPMDKIRLVTREDGAAITKTEYPAGGTIVDNKVHHIEVATEDEGHWLTMVLNSERVTEEVMSRSKGEPPNIYSIPAQVLADFKLKFDPRNSSHQSLVRVGRKLMTQMRGQVKSYLVDAKKVDPALVDDSELSPEVPSVIATRFMKWMRESEDWAQGSETVDRLIHRK